MRSRTLCVLAVVALVVSLAGSVAVASTISVATEDAMQAQVTLPTTLNDWYLYGNRKAGGTAISVSELNFAYPSDGNYPTYTYTDGTDPVSATNQAGTFMANTVTAVTFTMPVGVGPGQVQAWVASNPGTSVTLTGAFSSTLESAGALIPNATWTKFTYDFNSTEAQNLVISFSQGDACGFTGVTFSQVPEPGTIGLLASGVLGLLCYAWRKRR